MQFEIWNPWIKLLYKLLPQLKYISYVVLYCVYLYTVSHPITIMFSDERNYTLSLLGTSCKHCIYFIHFTYFTCVLSPMTVSICSLES